MSPLLIMVLLLAVPFLLGFIFRVHTSAYFLSIASGYLLSQFFGETSGLVAQSFFKTEGSAIIAQSIVFVLPIVITLWLMRGSLVPRQLVVHVLPLIGCALLVVVFGVQLLPQELQNSVYSHETGVLLRRMPDVIVGVAVLLQLALMWLTARPHHD